VMATLGAIGGDDVAFAQMDFHAPVWTDPDDPWVRQVFALMATVTGETTEPAIASYFTDASPLTKAYGHPPTLILGPGEPHLAHQTDEYCLISRIEEARHAFTEIARGWCGI
jgi:succinyl-diaminopimelate desuccinylase